MTYLDKLDSVFWITLGGLIFTFFGVVLRYCFKSKCSKITCCWFSITRDVEAEVEEHIIDANHGVPDENNV